MAIQALAEAGADELAVSDTVGYADPASVRRIIKAVMAAELDGRAEISVKELVDAASRQLPSASWDDLTNVAIRLLVGEGTRTGARAAEVIRSRVQDKLRINPQIRDAYLGGEMAA